MNRNSTFTVVDPLGTAVVENVLLGAVRGAANVVVTKGTTWKYYAKGTLPTGTGSLWYNSATFDDSTWGSGGSELGYGDSTDTTPFPEGTKIGYGGDTANRYITTYFRTKVAITNVSNIDALDLRVMRDDGIIFYINGRRAFRNNLSTTNPTYSTLAADGSTNEHVFLNAATLGNGISQNWEGVAPAPSLLVEGTNLFAAQVHQTSASSSDLSFDAKLSITRRFNTGLLKNDTDADGDALTAQLDTPPGNGVAVVNANGTFSYTPNPGFFGTDSFTYIAKDASGSSEPATVVIDVAVGSNQAPVANADSYATTEDTALNINAAAGLLANDSDVDFDTLIATVLTAPSKGNLILNTNGSFVYTPFANQFGTDSFTYTATDGLDSSTATVTITIAGVNDEPVVVNDNYTFLPDKTTKVSAALGVLSNDSDADGNQLTLSLVQTASQGQLDLLPDGSFTYTPRAGFLGADSFSYRASDGVVTSPIVTVTINVGDTLVINEILFRPGTTYPENTTREFIELYNRGDFAINLGGYALTAGVQFVIPPNTIIAPNGYLVIAANVASFQAANPTVANVVGGWTGSLSGSAEKVTLSDPYGSDRDSVTYASEGDWAQRVRETTYQGWEWSPLTSGGGRSIELRNPNISNDNGQNWQPSQVAGGTPGQVNAAFSTNIPPIIKGVNHAPAVPKSTDVVLISCSLNDDSPVDQLSATLYWRNATTTSPGAFAAVPMSSDLKGGWFAPLPAMANLTIVEFYISATDGVNTRTWPAPTAEGQNANCQYQVDNEVPSTTQEMYRLILTATDNAAWAATSSSSDREFNQTLVVTRGAESTIRYRCGMRTRGNSSRTYQFRPLRINIPCDDDLDGVTSFNCNPRSSFLQFFGNRLFQAAGLRAPHSIPMELRRNGVEYTTSSGSTPDYGLWARVDDVSAEFVDRHWPENNSGSTYKKGRPDQYWKNTTAAPTDPHALLDGWSKQNNRSEGDWSDLKGFFSRWMATCSSHFPTASANNVAGGNGNPLSGIGAWDGTIFNSTEVAELETVSDLEQWARWFAVMTILQDNETNISNGQDDDYAVYFEPRTVGNQVQRRMQLIPHDLDTIFGMGDSTLAYNGRGLFDMTDDGSVFRPLLPLIGSNTVTGNASFRTMYINELRQLLGSVFNTDTTSTSNPPFYAAVDDALSNWVPTTTRTAIKTFVNQRRTYLLGLLSTTAVNPAAGTSISTVNSVHGNLMLHEVLANNISAHNNAGLFPDVIELHNAGATAMDITGMSLTDDPFVKAKFVFPSGTTIAAGGYLIVYADSELAAPGLHAGFGLDADGDSLTLYDAVGNGQALVDTITFGLQVPNLSIGRTGATLNTWALCTPSINAPNVAVTLSSPNGLVINEWLGNADYRVANDFIELYNPGANPVAIGGMYLTDDEVNYPTRGLLPVLSFLPATGFAAFEPVGSSANAGNARQLDYKLDATFGSVSLLGANGKRVNRVDVIAQFRDGSRGRVPDGGPAISRLSIPSPGASNAALPANDLNLLNFLRITELMYNPQTTGQSEYIELRNMSDKSATPVTLDLNGVYFASGITYVFPSVSLAPGAHFLLVGESAKFTSQFPAATIGGTFTSGKLDNSGERIQLSLPSGTASILDFSYSDSWYPTTDGQGAALQIVDATAAPALWDVKDGWQATAPSPGTSPAFSVIAGPDQTIPVGQILYLSGTVILGDAAASSISQGWSKDSGPGNVTFTTANYKEANARFTAPGIYVLRFSATASPLGLSSTLQVMVTESYANWAARLLTGTWASSAGQANDADGDGLPNLVEFATGTNPTQADSPLQITVEDGHLIVRYQRSKLADPNCEIIPQFATELTDWSDRTNSGYVMETIESSNATSESWKAEFLQDAAKAFVRLKVNLP